MATVDINSGLDSLPTAKDLARGAVFLEGPEGLLVSWFLIGAFVIASSSIGFLGMLLLVPVVLVMLGIGFVWFLVQEFL